MKSSPGVLPMASPADLAFEKGLPSNPDAERYVLGSILLNDSAYLQAAGALEPDDFSLEKHRRIFARMKDLYDRGSRIDRITLADELMKQALRHPDAAEGVASFVERRAPRFKRYQGEKS